MKVSATITIAAHRIFTISGGAPIRGARREDNSICGCNQQGVGRLRVLACAIWR
jgi:hypothetical protein